MRRTLLKAAMAGALAVTLVRPSLAEQSELRIAVQPGLTYLTFTLMEQGQLIEKHVRAAGLAT